MDYMLGAFLGGRKELSLALEFDLIRLGARFITEYEICERSVGPDLLGVSDEQDLC